MSLPAVLLTLRRDNRRLALASISAATSTKAGMSGAEAVKEYSRIVLAEADQDIETEPPDKIAASLGIPCAP